MSTRPSAIPIDFNWSRPNVLAIHYSTSSNKEIPVLATAITVVSSGDGQSQTFPSTAIDRQASHPLVEYEKKLLSEFASFVTAHRDSY